MKPFTTVAVAFLSLIAILQLTRVIRGWEVVINGVSIPLWASGVACVPISRPRNSSCSVDRSARARRCCW
jgi:hypothetical protein